MIINILQINEALIVVRTQTEHKRTDSVNILLRFGPAIISELDEILLGRKGLNQLR